MRGCIGAEQLRSDESGGCCPLLFGESDGTAWGATFCQFVYNAGFALAAVFIVPAAVVDAAPCCVNALAASSFTGTYTLASFAWVYLALDSAQAVARATWLVHRHANMRADESFGAIL